MTQTRWISFPERIYRALLRLYPAEYRLEYGPSMVQVFRDVSRAAYRQRGRAGLALWWVVTLADLVRTAIEQRIEKRPVLTAQSRGGRESVMTMQKWGGIASFALAVSLIVAPLIYLVGDLREALGPLGYALADFLFGPLSAASLVAAVYALRERIGERAPNRMSLALLAAALAAAMFVIAASLRSVNRGYALYLERYPVTELPDRLTATLLMSWTTIVSGVIASGRHFQAWSLILTGSAGWSSKALPRPLCILYLLCGVPLLFAYLAPVQGGGPLADASELNVAIVVVCVVWQGIVLWTGGPGQTKALEVNPEPA